MENQKQEQHQDSAKQAIDLHNKRKRISKFYPIFYGLETFVATLLGFRIVLHFIQASPEHWLPSTVTLLTDPLVYPFVGISEGLVFGFEVDASSFIAMIFYSIILHLVAWILQRVYIYRLTETYSTPTSNSV